MHKLKRFLSKNLFNILHIEKKLRIPRGILAYWVKNKRDLPKKHLHKVIQFCCDNGFKINGYQVLFNELEYKIRLIKLINPQANTQGYTLHECHIIEHNVEDYFVD